MPRRIYTYDHHGLWETYNLISTIGSGVMTLGILVIVFNVIKTTRVGARAGNDPWLGNTLEWFTSSPPPPEKPPSIQGPPGATARISAIMSAAAYTSESCGASSPVSPRACSP